LSAAAPTNSAERLAANRANALSTGPSTEEGKARSSQNARKHGFYADPSSVACPEDAEELARLREDLIQFHQPLNSQEMLVIDKTARAQQAVLRAYRLESAVFASLLVPAPASEDQTPSANPLGDNFLRMDPKAWSGLLRYKAHADNAYHRAVDELDSPQVHPPPSPPAFAGRRAERTHRAPAARSRQATTARPPARARECPAGPEPARRVRSEQSGLLSLRS